jgi:hypothetical protein
LVGFTDGVRESAQRRLGGHNQLPKLIQGVKLNDGIKVAANIMALQTQAA